MSGCARCGAPDQAGRFCTTCGNPLAAPATEHVNLDKARGVGPADPTVLGPIRPDAAATGASSALPPTGSYPLPSPAAPEVPSRGRRRGRGSRRPGGTGRRRRAVGRRGGLVTLRPVGGEGTATSTATQPTIVPATAAGSGGAPGSGSAGSPSRPAPVGPGGSKDDPGSGAASTPATTVTTMATTTVEVNPMGGDRADIACGTGYIV